MYEISLSIEKDRIHLLDKIEKRLNYSLRGINRVTDRSVRGQRAYFLIGCEEDAREYTEDCITYTIADIIITDFKTEYIKKNARFSINNEMNYQVFMNALVAFDRESDREIVTNNIVLDKLTTIDGLFNFRLREMRERWQEVVNLASENSIYLMYQDTFIELLKFLINTIESKVEEIDVEINDNLFSINSEYENELTYELLDIGENNTDKLIPVLINLAPKKIRLTKGDTLPENIRYLISEIYTEKAVFN